MRYLSAISALALSVAIAVAAPQQTATERFEKVINRLVESINKPDYVGIQRDFGEEMLKALPLEASTAFFKSLSSQYGKIEKLDSP